MSIVRGIQVILTSLAAVQAVWYWPADFELTDARIVDGTNVQPGQLVYTALLRSNYGIVCGGSILTRRWVLTAAHCINMNATYHVRVGSVEFDKGQSYDIVKKIPHPNYASAGIKNDLGLMKTARNIVFGAFVGPIALPNAPLKENSSLLASGFGLTKGGGSPSATLQMISVQSLGSALCAKLGTPIDQGKMCTLALNGGTVCFGDSGGPCAVKSGNNYTVYGITSYILRTEGGCGRNLPNVFTNVFNYKPWIISTMRNN